MNEQNEHDNKMCYTKECKKCSHGFNDLTSRHVDDGGRFGDKSIFLFVSSP